MGGRRNRRGMKRRRKKGRGDRKKREVGNKGRERGREGGMQREFICYRQSGTMTIKVLTMISSEE